MPIDEKYSIIDIETTGGYRQGHKITEIAICNFENGVVVDEFSTLINPEIPIPTAITYLTGINDEMVKDAPKFYEVAKKIVEMTEGRVFVAHNVFFDYNFIKHEFNELGYRFQREKLCTVRLARKYIPGHKSYSLGKICDDLGIEIEGRHRALGDTLATVELFKLILANVNGSLAEDLVQEKGKIALPPGLPREQYESLPEKPGVYYFFNENDELIYVGKSKNIKTRVSSHFRPDMKRKKDIQIKNQVAKIKFKELGSDLAASLYECHEIKNHRPMYNRVHNRRRFPYALRLIERSSGELEIECRRHDDEELYLTYSTSKKAKKVRDIFYERILGVDPDSLFFQKKKDLLIKTIGLKNYNQMVTKEYERKRPKMDSFEHPIPGRRRGEQGLIVVENYRPVGMTFYSENESPEEGEWISLLSDQDMTNLLYSRLPSS